MGNLLLSVAVFASLVSAGVANQIQWAGRTWDVRDSGGALQDPGPNFFSASPDNVLVDWQGNLRLGVSDTNGKWVSGEIFLASGSLGYGTYNWTIADLNSFLDPNVVLGLFTYAQDPAQDHREIDVEFGQWSNPQDPNHAQWVLQPWGLQGHRVRWTSLPVNTATSPLYVSFTWTSGQIYWQAVQNGDVISAYFYSGDDVPTPGSEVVHMNLWLNQANPVPGIVAGPMNNQNASVLISNFEWTPY